MPSRVGLHLDREREAAHSPNGRRASLYVAQREEDPEDQLHPAQSVPEALFAVETPEAAGSWVWKRLRADDLVR